MNYQRAWAEINLAHLKHNFDSVKNMTHETRIMCIIKADAYGHGAVPVAKCLLDSGATAFGVAICEEGIQLRDSGVDVPILIMGFTPEPLLREVIRQRLTQTIFSLDGARALAAQAARENTRAVVHIKIDTGMSRLGFLPSDESIGAICEIATNPNLLVEGIYTHCATSDALENSFVFKQQARFQWVLGELAKRGLDIPIKHMANSGAITQTLLGVEGRGVYFDVVRPGILLYGYPPSGEMISTCAPMALKPVMRLMTQISMIKHLPAGVGISYGHIYTTTRPSVIAVLPVGYADGYPRRLSKHGTVMVNGQFAPIAGAICMDQCMVDVTDIPHTKPGDPVIMMGEPGICADNLADNVGTISYEILCGIGKRVPRVYV